MDDSLKAFVERQNIANYIEQLRAEADSGQRALLLQLLAEEKAKQIEASALASVAASYTDPLPRDA